MWTNELSVFVCECTPMCNCVYVCTTVCDTVAVDCNFVFNAQQTACSV